MNNLTMDAPPLLNLCQPVDPFTPITINIRYKKEVTYTLRTLDVGNDVKHVLEWLGDGVLSDHPDMAIAADTFYQSYLATAADDNFQALMVTINGEPALQIDVRIGSRELLEVTGMQQCYVLNLKANQAIRLRAIKNGIAFAFSSIMAVTNAPALFVQVEQSQTYWHVVCKQMEATEALRTRTPAQVQTLYRFDKDQTGF